MKKKILSFIVAVCLFIPCLFMLSACGSDSVVGKYTLSEVGMGEVSWTKEQYEEKKDSDDLDETEQMLSYMAAMMFGSENDVTIEFKEDGTCFIDGSIMGQETAEEGTYTVDGNKIILDGEDSEEAQMIYENGKIIVSITQGEQTIKMIFTKNA